MSTGRDPLGKRALFSPIGAPEPREEPHKPGPLDVTVHCSSCDATTTLGAPAFLLQHFPLAVWTPWRKQTHFMRCPSCGKFSWLAVRRAG